jgi:hypothetical protein
LVDFWNIYQDGKVEINSLSKDTFNATGRKWKPKNLEQISNELNNIDEPLTRVITAQIN